LSGPGGRSSAGLKLQEIKFEGTRFEGVRLTRVTREGVRLEGVRLETLKLEGVRLETLKLEGVRLASTTRSACPPLLPTHGPFDALTERSLSSPGLHLGIVSLRLLVSESAHT
jgi:hypothetical protein